MKVEKSKMSNRERNQKRKFARGGSSSGNKIRESKAKSVYSFAARGRRQGPTVALVSAEALQPNKVKSQNALIAINDIRVFADG